jgi:PadR family transcriptional regulator
MPHEGLGEFEQMVLLAVVRLSNADGDVYGVPIVEEIEKRTKRKAARAAVYITLRRLERKGLIASWTSEPSDERGGKARHCVKMTAAGTKALREARWAMNQMWTGLDIGAGDRR